MVEQYIDKAKEASPLKRKNPPHPRKAADAQTTHSQHGEVVTKNNDAELFPRLCHWNEYTLNHLQTPKKLGMRKNQTTEWKAAGRKRD